jgi:hypothetical protein
MLIWIDLAGLDFANELPPDALNALIDLGEAGYKANHAVLAARRDLRVLAGLQSLSPRARAYFNRAYEEFTQLGHIASRPNHVVASYTQTAPVLMGGVWRVPLQLFSQDEYVRPSLVVCENDADFDVIRELVLIYVRQNIKGVALAATSHPGGGAGTVTVLRRLFRDPNPNFLCVLDSDREVVLGAEGSTARGVRNVWFDGIWRARLYVLTARELENVLPVELVRQFCRDEAVNQPLVERLHLAHRDVVDYLCLKSGEKPCRLHEVSRDHRGFERNRVALIQTARTHPDFSRCGGVCGECSCAVVPELGDRFLDRFSSWIRHPASWRAAPDFSQWHEDLRSVAEMFLDAAIALPRKL